MISKFNENPILFSLWGKPMPPLLLLYQGLAVDDHGFALDVSDLGHPRLSLIEGITLYDPRKNQ